MPMWGWRGVFFVGILPALFTLWVRRHVEEPAIWRESRARAVASRGRFSDIFRGPRLRLTLAGSSTAQSPDNLLYLVGASAEGRLSVGEAKQDAGPIYVGIILSWINLKRTIIELILYSVVIDIGIIQRVTYISNAIIICI